MTNKGLRIDLRLLERREEDAPVALLDCHYEDDFSGVIGIVLERTSNTFVFTRHLTKYPRKWGTEEIEEAEVRTIYLSQHQRKYEARDVKCLIRRDSLRNSDYQVLKVLPSSFRWNKETGVVFVTLAYGYKTRIDSIGAKLVIEFYNEQFENQFAVILSLRGQRFHFPGKERQLTKNVKIISQLEGGTSHILLKGGWEDTTERTWRTWKCEDTQLVNVSRHPQGTGTMKITAVASEEEILNQKVLVLDVDCNWVILPIKDKTADSS